MDYKARQGKNCYYKFGIIYYYYRYGLLEHANFPLLTYENGIVFLQVLIATFLYFFGAPGCKYLYGVYLYNYRLQPYMQAISASNVVLCGLAMLLSSRE